VKTTVTITQQQQQQGIIYFSIRVKETGSGNSEFYSELTNIIIREKSLAKKNILKSDYS
jgi:hypothetical protein